MNIKIKRLPLLIMAMILFVLASNGVYAVVSQEGINMYEFYFPDQKPYIDENNRTLVPVRFISEQLGATVEWNASKKQVDISYGENIICLTVGSSQAIKYSGRNEEVIDMGTKAVLNQGRVFVPLRFLSEIMGNDVFWDEKLRIVLVNKRLFIDLSYKSSVSATSTGNVKALQIGNFFSPQGVYFSEESLRAGIILRNNSHEKKEVWVRVIYKGPTNGKHTLPAQRIILLPAQTFQQEISWVIPENILSGSYQSSLEVWDKSPEQSGANLLGTEETMEGLKIFHQYDDFDSFNSEVWKKSDHTLEMTFLRSRNVTVSNGKLRIHMPANVYEGGEFQSRQPLGFGAYEIRMKIPEVPSSITGFFLYHAPDLYHEIDIEIYNQKNGDFFLTTYADGEKKNLHIDKVPYDLTKGFHNYRIEYYPDRVAFYIDDVFIKAWTEGFTKDKMYLVVNSWYPYWLEGTPAKDNNSYLEIDWIRY